MVLLEDVTDVRSRRRRPESALEPTPVKIMGHECRVTVSIGIAIYPDDAADAATLMKHADIAMYLAKDEGKNNYQFYSADMSPMSVEHLGSRRSCAARWSATSSPAVSAEGRHRNRRNQRRGGAAALVEPRLGHGAARALHSAGRGDGPHRPDRQVGHKTACEQNVAWQTPGLPAIVMSVNLSPRQFKDPTLLDDIAEILQGTGMAPELLELEITETMIMNNIDTPRRRRLRIKALGVRLAIDDFGTGYSSLVAAQAFPDRHAEDRSVVRSRHPAQRGRYGDHRRRSCRSARRSEFASSPKASRRRAV